MRRDRGSQALRIPAVSGSDVGKEKTQGERVKGSKGKLSRKGGSVKNDGRVQAEAREDGNHQSHKLDQWYFT